MKNIDNFLIKGFFSLTILILGVLLFISQSNLILLKLTLVNATFLMLYIFKKTLSFKIINLFIIFASSYLIPVFYYTFFQKTISTYDHSNSLDFLLKYTYMYCLFFTSVLLILPDFRLKQNFKIVRKSNFIIFYINIFICLFIAIYSKSGDSLMLSGGYGQSEISNLGGFAIGEYFLIFFLIAYKFSGFSRIKSLILFSVAGLYIIKSLAFGLRNEFIQLSILLFIIYKNESINKFVYYLALFFGLYFNSIFASFRSNPVMFLENSISENFSPFNLLKNDDENYITHQGDVIHSSCRLINFRDNNITDNYIELSSAGYFLTSIIIPQKYLPEHANMAAFKQDQYPVGGGGNIFAYFYFWLWYPGVILIGFIVGLLVRNYVKYINSVIGVYFILVFATFPRWFAYSPINIFKMCMYGLLVYIIFSIFDNKMKKLKKIAP